MAIEIIKVPKGFSITQLLVEQPDPEKLKALISGTVTVEQPDPEKLKALISGTVTVEQPDPTKLKLQTQKLSPAIADLDAIEDVIGEVKVIPNTSAGTNILTFTVVPSGKLQVITHIIAYAVLGMPSIVEIYANIDGTNRLLITKLSPGQETPVYCTEEVFLDASDGIVVKFFGMLITQNVTAVIVGKQISKY